jgi:hypothetical protein
MPSVRCFAAVFPAGLYKQLTTLRDLLNDVRGDPNSVTSLKLPIASNVDACGLQVSCGVGWGRGWSWACMADVVDWLGVGGPPFKPGLHNH